MRVQHKFLLKTDTHSLAPIISPVVDARTDSVTESVVSDWRCGSLGSVLLFSVTVSAQRVVVGHV